MTTNYSSKSHSNSRPSTKGTLKERSQWQRWRPWIAQEDGLSLIKSRTAASASECVTDSATEANAMPLVVEKILHVFLICLYDLLAQALDIFIQDDLCNIVCSDKSWRTEIASSIGAKGRVTIQYGDDNSSIQE